jgi:hypothetical protein
MEHPIPYGHQHVGLERPDGELLKPNLMFTEEQWDLMKDFVKILAPCEQISRELSSQKYPSISRVI